MTSNTITENQKPNEFFDSIGKFILINLGIASAITIFYCPTCLFSFEGLKSIGQEFVFAFLFSCVLSFGGSKVDQVFDDKVSWIYHPAKRLIYTVVSYMLYCFITTFLIITVINLLLGEFTLSTIPWKGLVNFTKQPMVVALIFMSIFTTRSWLMEWRKTAIEAEKLRSEKLASQYQSLKNQLNPHFLFNSLNVLSNLVYENADKSADFIQKLSKIYRYVLDAQEEELVPLSSEIEFAKNYLELQKIRFEENLVFTFKLMENQNQMLPPLSLQLLLENAIKHNIASQENPLFIHISQEGNELWISNTYQPKTTQIEDSTGIGLKNIELRYEILGNRKPIIIQNENEFVVRLPLLTVDR